MYGIDATDKSLPLQAVFDELLNGAHLQTVLAADAHQIVTTGHLAIRPHHFDDQRRRTTARKPREIDGAFRLSHTLEDASGTGSQRVDVARPHEVIRPGVRINRELDGLDTIGRRDAGADAMLRMAVDGDGEGRTPHGCVDCGLRMQFQTIAVLWRQAEAQVAPTDAGEEVDHLGSHELRREHHVPFILSSLIVHQNDDTAISDVFEDVGDGAEHGIRGVHDCWRGAGHRELSIEGFPRSIRREAVNHARSAR